MFGIIRNFVPNYKKFKMRERFSNNNVGGFLQFIKRLFWY